MNFLQIKLAVVRKGEVGLVMQPLKFNFQLDFRLNFHFNFALEV